MAGLFGKSIIAICLSTASGQYNEACQKAWDAGTRQVGIRQDADKAEDKTVDLAKVKATAALGKEPVEVATAGFYVYKVYKNKTLDFKLPNFGLADRISNQITTNSYKLTFLWKW